MGKMWLKKKNEEDKSVSKPINDEIDQYVMDKLELITLIAENYHSISRYAEYRKNIENINNQVKKLEFIKDSLMIF